MGSASRALPCDARVCGKVSVHQVACVSLKGPFFKSLTKKRQLGLMGFEGHVPFSGLEAPHSFQFFLASDVVLFLTSYSRYMELSHCCLLSIYPSMRFCFPQRVCCRETVPAKPLASFLKQFTLLQCPTNQTMAPSHVRVNKPQTEIAAVQERGVFNLGLK